MYKRQAGAPEEFWGERSWGMGPAGAPYSWALSPGDDPDGEALAPGSPTDRGTTTEPPRLPSWVWVAAALALLLLLLVCCGLLRRSWRRKQSAEY